MNMYYVYFLIDPRSKDSKFRLPFYIGKGSANRANKHLKETKENTINNKKLCKIKSIRNAGFEPEIHIIYKDLDEDTAYSIEAALIKFYGRKDIDENGILTNICSDSRPPSHKGKIRGPRSQETKDKLSKANKGQIPWNKNKIGLYKQTEEANEKRRKFNLDNNIVPPSAKGVKRSAEFKENARKKRLGKSSGMLGRKHSAKSIKLMRKKALIREASKRQQNINKGENII